MITDYCWFLRNNSILELTDIKVENNYKNAINLIIPPKNYIKPIISKEVLNKYKAFKYITLLKIEKDRIKYNHAKHFICYKLKGENTYRYGLKVDTNVVLYYNKYGNTITTSILIETRIAHYIKRSTIFLHEIDEIWGEEVYL